MFSGSARAATPCAQDFLAQGRAWYLRHAYVQAMRAFVLAAQCEPGEGAAYYGVAACAFVLGRRRSARRWAEAALERSPSDHASAALLLRLGEPYALAVGEQGLQAGQVTYALAAFGAAVRQDPRSPLGWKGEAICLERLGRDQEARKALARARALDPQDASLARVLARPGIQTPGPEAARDIAWGNAWLKRGDAKRAEACFRGACAVSPEAPDCWYSLALARYRLKDGPGMLRALERCLALDPRHPGGLYLKAKYQQRTGQAAAARDTLASLAALGPAGGFGLLAQSELGQVPAQAGMGLHGSVRLMAGPQVNQSDTAAGVVRTRSLGSQDELNLSYGLALGKRVAATLSYGMFIVPYQYPGQPLNVGQPLSSLDALVRYTFNPRWSALLDGNGGVRQNFIHWNNAPANYEVVSARTELDGRVLGMQPFSLGIQALAERFPTYAPYDDNSLLPTLGATWMSRRGDLLGLILGGRLARPVWPGDTMWGYDNAFASINARLMLPKGFYVSFTGVWTPQAYLWWPASPPNLPAGGRLDEQGYADLELDRGLPGGFSVFVGAQWAADTSNIQAFSNATMLGYAGIGWGR